MDMVTMNYAMLRPTHPPVPDALERAKEQERAALREYYRTLDEKIDLADAEGRFLSEDDHDAISKAKNVWYAFKCAYELAYERELCQHEWVTDTIGTMWFVGEGGCDDDIQTRQVCRKCGKVMG